MAFLDIKRVLALPAQLVARTLYMVADAQADSFDIVVVGTDVTKPRHLINRGEIAAMIAAAVAAGVGGGAAQEVFFQPTIAARDAMVPAGNIVVWVGDATGDVTVAAGAAMYFFDFTGNSGWHKISEGATLDAVVSWDKIDGRPTSTPAAIDASVSATHAHANLAVLDVLTKDSDNRLLLDGAPVANFISEEAW